MAHRGTPGVRTLAGLVFVLLVVAGPTAVPGATRVVRPNAPAALDILNLGAGTDPVAGYAADPCDGRLEIVLRVPLPAGWNVFKRGRVGTSVVPATSVAIRSDEPISLFADGEPMAGTRFDVGIEPKSLKLITGRHRKFGTAS